MIMATGLDLRLRILIPAAENSIAGNAFRPGDVLASRRGTTVEIGNTDAEGRLVLADALALGDEERPELLASFATLTGAARVALGPDLPPLYTDDDALAAAIAAAGLSVGDPVWRLPFWDGLESLVLTFPVLMWLRRVIGSGGLPDDRAVETALKIVDDNFGFNPLLGSFKQRTILGSIRTKDDLPRLVAWYGRSSNG